MLVYYLLLLCNAQFKQQSFFLVEWKKEREKSRTYVCMSQFGLGDANVYLFENTKAK